MDNRRDSKKTRSSLLRNNDESGDDDTNTLDTLELGTNGTLAMGSSFSAFLWSFDLQVYYWPISHRTS